MVRKIPGRPLAIGVEIPIRQEVVVLTVLRALEELIQLGVDVTLRLAVRRDESTAFNPWHAIQERGLAQRVVYLPFFDNADLPDVIGDVEVWLETTEPSAPCANFVRAMQTDVVVAGRPGLPVPAHCFWPVGDFERADELARRLAALLASEQQMEALKASARQYVEDHLPFSCAPLKYVSPFQERTFRGAYSVVLFISACRPEESPGPSGLTKRWLEGIRSLGNRIIYVHYALPDRSHRNGEGDGPGTSEAFLRHHVDYDVRVAATSAHAGINPAPYSIHVDDWCGGELTLKVQEICNTYSVGVCFVQGAYLSRVLDRVPDRIRRVLAIDSAFEADRFVTRGSIMDGFDQAASLTLDGERTACARADVILTTSDDDRTRHQALAPSKEVHCFDSVLQPAGDAAHTMAGVLSKPFTVPDHAHPHFLDYHDATMKDLLRFVKSFAGQVMLEVGPDDYLALARSVLASGAERVIGVQTTEQAYDDLPDGLEFAAVSPTQWEGVQDESIDVVYGVAVLEHITHVEEIVDEIVRVLKPGGRVCLHGCPMWTSADGHHVVVFDSGDGHMKYDFTRPERNPLEAWQHLAATQDQIRDELLQKQVPARDVDAILAMVFGEGIGSNRKIPGEIIAAFQRRLQTDTVRHLSGEEGNRHYRDAEQRYPEKELLTNALTIYARKPARTEALPGGPPPLVSVIIPLFGSAPTMRRALDSVANQTYANLEVLLVADALSGSCLAVAEEYVGVDSRFHLRPPPSTRGYVAAINRGVNEPTGGRALLYDGDAPLECRTIETLVLSRQLLTSAVNPPGLSDIGSAFRLDRGRSNELRWHTKTVHNSATSSS